MQANWITLSPPSPDLSLLDGQDVVSVLDDCGVLEIAGPDSSKFLQGQLTCNLQDITPEASRLGAHCTHQGRMVASFRLLQCDAARYLFVLPKPTLAGLHASLGKYIVFSKAKLRDASQDFLALGLSGSGTTQIVAQLFGAAPDEKHSQVLHDNGIVICIDEQSPRYLCLLHSTTAEALWPTIATSTVSTDSHYWQWRNIRDGIGEVREQTVGEFIPQMLNLQVLDGISFTKGCYTGQEIVARMQYRGTLKKSMQRISGAGPAPSPNDALRHAAGEQAAGHVVIAENIDENRWEGLAVLPRENNDEAVQTETGQAVQLLELPYSVALPENRK